MDLFGREMSESHLHDKLLKTINNYYIASLALTKIKSASRAYMKYIRVVYEIATVTIIPDLKYLQVHCKYLHVTKT